MFSTLSDHDKRLLDDDRIEIIGNGENGLYKPLILDGLSVTQPRGGAPATMEFEVLEDGENNLLLGDQIRFRLDKKNFFFGYVFKAEYTKEEKFKVKCYDQARYLKYKDTILYEDKTYSELLIAICRDRGLVVGEIEDTKYKIPRRAEESKEYWEMLEEASKLTTAYTGEVFVLFDRAGKICLKNIKNMKVDCPPITKRLGEDVSYDESIDDATYNRVKVDVTDKERQRIVPVIEEDIESIRKWGVLQRYEKSSEPLAQVRQKAKSLLEQLNHSTRTLKLEKLFGIPECRGGSLLPVILNLRGIEINGYVLCESVKHEFNKGQHFMTIDAYNKDFLPKLEGDDKIFENETDGLST